MNLEYYSIRVNGIAGGGERLEGAPLASLWHSAIGALSTRLFHNVNEKVKLIFVAASTSIVLTTKSI